jgi:soluble lytic murein transglycosylase
LAIFVSLYLSSALATPNLNFAATAPADEAPFHLNFGPLDYQYGRDIDILFSQLEKNQLKKNTLDDFSKYQFKNHSFAIFDPIYNRLKPIVAINDQDNFYKDCGIVSKNINLKIESIADKLNISIDKHCRYLFLKRLSDLSPNINFSSRDLAYFKEAAPFFANGENQLALGSFLSHFKVNALEHEKLSNILIERYIEFKIKPSNLVFANLKLNVAFNRFLQNNLNLDDISNSYFQDEYQRLSREAQEAVDKGEFLQAKHLITAAVNFYSHNKNFINNKKAWYGVILTGKALVYKGKDKEAIDIFALAKSIASAEDFSETSFYLLWPYILNKDFKVMKSVVEKNNFEKNFDKFDSKLQFWIAFSFLKNDDEKKATALFNKIIEISPFTFYSIISLKQLAVLNKNPNSETEILARFITKTDPKEYSLEKTSSHLKDALKRLSVWNKLGNERFSNLEIRYIQSLAKENTFDDLEFAKSVTPMAHKEFLITNLVRMLNSQKKYISSFKVFQESLEKNSLSLNYKLIKFIFPLNYIDLIKKNASDIDPLIIISLVRQESAFNPEASSGVGAKGLMQLMPATAKRFNRRVKVGHLANPEINLAIGIKYLRQLITRFDGNLIYALASYNAGENRIDRWRKDIFRSDEPLSTIESIPFEETRNYVKLIYRNNFFYSLLSNKPALMIPLEETFKIAQIPKDLD